MTREELYERLNEIQKIKCETQNYEYKSAHIGCPKRLYDTLSSFSNQDEGGIIFFGIDEEQNYKEVGVYDAQDLQKKINEQSLQMEPVVRPLITVAERNGNVFLSAEIPGIDVADRPCYYKGKGRIKGSYTRVGDSDEPMTEYEVYSYEAFRKKYQDDIREIPRATWTALNKELLDEYMYKIKAGKQNLSKLQEEEIFELISITRNHQITLSAVMLFSPYPQAYVPGYCITAVSVPGNEIGDMGGQGERFLDNQRIEGTIPEMLEGALQFAAKNMKRKTIIDSETGKRKDRTEYPITAVREAVLNALVHRDYSIHTEGMPIQIIMYENRMEIKNPGGIYGRMQIDKLGKIQPDTRNPVLAFSLELMGVTENRYSGIPTIRKEMQRYNLKEPQFADERGSFIVTFYKETQEESQLKQEVNDEIYSLILFCKTPRTRQEISEYLGINSVSYAINTYVMPLVKTGQIKLSIPDKPKSQKQLYYSGDIN